MDFDDEWELLEISAEAGKQIYSRNPSAASVVHMNYPQFVETTTNQILHAPDRDQPIQSKIESFSADQDPISQDLFNKLKEAESVDMKVESPKYEAREDPRKLNSGMERSLSGLCSFGVAAATFCIVVFANKHPHQNRKLRFRIHTDDKVRICRSN